MRVRPARCLLKNGTAVRPDFPHLEATLLVRCELAGIEALLAKVIASHGPAHRELREVQRQFCALGDELIHHRMKEE